jgi:diguanylate cyclase (GGDEF)-like protein
MTLAAGYSFKRSFAFKLLKIVFSIYLSVTLVITALQMFREYVQEEDEVLMELKHAEHIFKANLVNALWNYDEGQIRAIEQGIMYSPTIVGMQLYDLIQDKYISHIGFAYSKKRKIIHNEKKKPSPYLQLFMRKFALEHDGRVIGEAVLYSSNLVVLNKVKYHFFILVLAAVVKTIVLWAVFFWAFNKFLTRPLNLFCHAMERVDLDNRRDSQDLSLGALDIYELSRLEYMFNSMRHRIQDTLRKYDVLNKTLEEQVHTRTKELQQSNQQLKKANCTMEKYLKLIEKNAITDDLTGLFNRRYFNQIFPESLQLARKNNRSISFIMLDIDYFKKYNDNYGHQKGDQVLAEIGKTIKVTCQYSSNIPLRLGGEEFGIILLKTGHQESKRVADRIRREIEELKISHAFNDASAYVTASCGLVSCAEVTSHVDMDELYKLADKALYIAKEKGRNHVDQITL